MAPEKVPPTDLPTELPPPPTELNSDSFLKEVSLQLNRARHLHLVRHLYVPFVVFGGFSLCSEMVYAWDELFVNAIINL
jgi:hypothetical protein